MSGQSGEASSGMMADVLARLGFSPAAPLSAVPAGMQGPTPPPRSSGKKRKPPPRLPSLALQRPPPATLPGEQAMREHLGKLYLDGQVYPINDSSTFVETDSADSHLGRGCFGVVRRITHRATGRVLAVKLMRDTMKPEEKRRLVMEINLCRQFDSPFLVRYHGVNTWNGDVQLYMELMRMDLDSLRAMAAKAGVFVPEPIMGRITASLLRALDYLKEEFQVMHRDIKPSNVLLGHDGSIKLCDFGIANVTVKSLLASHVGSELYLPPERLAPAERQYDIRSDVWSLGVTLDELALLRFPYQLGEQRSIFALIEAVVEEDPPLPSAEHYSEDFLALVTSCLQKDKARRPKYRTASTSRPALLEHAFFVQHNAAIDSVDVDINAWVNSLGVERVIKAPPETAMDLGPDGDSAAAAAPPPPPPRHSKMSS